MTAPSGVLVVDKPSGPTSHDVVRQARRILGTPAVGHAGTLDPLASGVLLLLVGEGRKLSPYLSGSAKRYRATVRLGRATSTLDALGATTEERPVGPGHPDPVQLNAALEAERLRTEQVPPTHSALHVAGVRAYRLARSGVDWAPPARPVAVAALLLRDARGGDLVVELDVSKGYYVRAFARDLGERLGYPAHLAALTRLSSGAFTLAEAEPWPPAGRPRPLGVEDAAARCLPLLRLGPDGAARARAGRALAGEHFEGRTPPPAGPSAWLDPRGKRVAVGAAAEGGGYRVLRGFR